MSRSSHQRQQQLATHARQMRQCPTLSEARLWQALRGSRIGIAFRRQAVIGSHIVDFLAPKARLVVEVDGGYHYQRDRSLERAGYSVLRIQAEEVMADLPRALERIVKELG